MTTETILTDDQIDHIIEDVAWPNEEMFNFGREVSRAIEQAVLTKLAEQHTLVAWLHEETGDVISSELKNDAPEMLKGYDVPLYAIDAAIEKEKQE